MSSPVISRLLPLLHRLQTADATAKCRLDDQGLHCGQLRLLPDTSTLPPPAFGIEFLAHPLQEEYGFMLMLSGQDRPPTDLTPYLDRLAPASQAWLYCGPHGSAQFCRRVFDALFHLCGPILGTMTLHTPPLPDYPALLQKQQELASHLQALCEGYRAAQQDNCTLDYHCLLDAMRESPWQQPHFALQLARLLYAGLQQQAVCQEALETLFTLQTGRHHPS